MAVTYAPTNQDRADLQQIVFGEEATFGAGAVYDKFLPVKDLDTTGLKKDFHPADHHRTQSEGERGIIGAGGGQFTFTTWMTSHSLTTPSGAITEHPLATLLGASGAIIDVGPNNADGVDTGTTTSSLVCDTGGQLEGTGVLVEITTGNYEVTAITDDANDPTFPIAPSLDAAPADTMKVYNGLTLSFLDDYADSSDIKSLAFKLYNKDSNSTGTSYLCKGCRVSFRITAVTNEIIWAEVTVFCQYWEFIADGMAHQDYHSSVALPVVFNGGICTLGGDHANQTLIESFTFDLGLTVNPIKSGTATEGVAEFMFTRKTTLEMVIPRTDVNTTRFTGQTDTSVCIAWGQNTPGSCCAIMLKSARLEELPAPGEADGHLTHTMRFDATAYHSDTGDPGSASDHESKCVQLYFL